MKKNGSMFPVLSIIGGILLTIFGIKSAIDNSKDNQESFTYYDGYGNTTVSKGDWNWDGNYNHLVRRPDGTWVSPDTDNPREKELYDLMKEVADSKKKE